MKNVVKDIDKIKNFLHRNKFNILRNTQCLVCCSTDINRNIVYPTFFCNPMTLYNNEIAHTGVEIIEITSNDELDVEEHDSDNQNTTNHIYDTTKNNYTPSRTPEDVKYVRQEQKRCFERCRNNKTAFNQACTEFYGINCNDIGNSIPTNQFFTFNSDSSSETPDELKVTRLNDTSSDECWNSDESYDSHKAYGVTKKQNIQSVWNDCQKDMHYLFQNNRTYGISSQDSSTTDEEEPASNNIIHRLATPIPTYIPRLNLPSSPTLPTVTEVFEPNKSPLNIEGNNITSTLLQKSVNNWFNDEDIEINTKNVRQGNKLSTLLERENRRIKLKKIQENEVLQEQYFKPTNLVRTEICKSLKQIDKIANETFLNGIGAANINDSKEPQIKISPLSSQSTKINSNLTENNNDSCKSNENTKISDEIIEIYDCDLNTTATQDEGSFKEDIKNNNLLTKSKALPTDRCSTNCVPPLRFSFVVDSDQENKSCFKRILTFIRCCK